MGASSGGKKKYVTFRNRQRANLSFFIVVMFFAVFGIIVFTEIFFIDERGQSSGVFVRHGPLTYQHKDKGQEYDDGFQRQTVSRNRKIQSGPLMSYHTHFELLYELSQATVNQVNFYIKNEDYISIRVGAAMMNDESMGAILLGGGGRPPVALPVIDNSVPISSKAINELQLPPFPENSTLSEGTWQNVNNTRYKFFVFSAFYDQRKGQRTVRVIGATKTRGPERVWCRMWYKTSEYNTSMHVSITISAKIKVIRENWNLKYSACFVMCPLTNRTVPTSVSIVAHPRDPPTNLMLVINNYNETSGSVAQNRFGVCVKPLHFDYNREIQILEFIELNRLLGVDHFTFYNHTIGTQVGCLLQNYVDMGLVTILPWQLNILSQKEIRTEGLFAALNDCLYRSMYKYSHIVLIDLDEYIIPKYNETLPQLIDFLSHRLKTRNTGSFSFQNAFFYLQWADDDSVYDFEDPVSANLVTLKKTRRRSKLHPHKQRSKYICRPELTVEAGNHFVWEFIPGYSTFNVPSDAAILHHYRICEFGGDDCIKTTSVIDKTAYRYKDVLTESVTIQYERLKRSCKLSELKIPQGKVFNKLINLLSSGLES